MNELNNQLDRAEERIGEQENSPKEITQNATQKDRREQYERRGGRGQGEGANGVCQVPGGKEGQRETDTETNV